MRWLKELLDIGYAVILAVGLMGGVWGAVYYLFGAHGLAARLAGGIFFEQGLGGLSSLPLALLAVAILIFWLPRLQSSRPAGALLGSAVVGGYFFLFRVFTVGV